jgi:hypothetical protein
MLKGAIAQYGYPLLVLLLGSALVLTALPRVKASFNYLPVDSAINELNNRKNLDSQKVEVLIARAQQSLAVYDHPRYWADLSRLLLVQAEQTSGFNLKRHSLIIQAQYYIEQSLVRSPANSLLWFQYAKLDVLLNAVSDQTVKALNLSIMTGPYELGHLLPRLQLCLSLLSKFDKKDYSLLQSQILIAWEKSPKLFIQKIALQNHNMDKIRFLLQDKSPDVLAVMETEIEKTHP